MYAFRAHINKSIFGKVLLKIEKIVTIFLIFHKLFQKLVYTIFFIKTNKALIIKLSNSVILDAVGEAILKRKELGFNKTTILNDSKRFEQICYGAKNPNLAGAHSHRRPKPFTSTGAEHFLFLCA